MLRLLLPTVLLAVGGSFADVACPPLDEAFRKVAENESAVCHCYEHGFYYDVDGISIGCSGRTMPAVFAALAAVNNTVVGKVRIWDSALDILPADMFAKVQPKSLSIERSGVAVLRDDVFVPLGPRLKELSLKGNLLLEIDENMLKSLKRLQVLDLTSNKVTSIQKKILDATPDLRELLLDSNDISSIEDGAFESLKGLTKLSLAGNQLTNITKNTFKGLESLEVLNLQNNQITSIDWAAFSNMNKLRILDLGTNHVTNVELRGLEKLEKLFLNNNSIQSLKNVSLRDLPALILISMDRNMVSEIRDGDLFGLSRSTRLESLTLASNNISEIAARALNPIQHVSILAIQNNHLTSLSSDGQSFLRPLRRLTTLLLSGNQIKSIQEDDLPKTISILAADHNQLEKIDGRAFAGMSMRRLFINDNQLAFLPRHTFDSFSMDTLEAVDVSSNTWQCVCGEEWLGSWLDQIGDRDVGDGPLGCLAARRCGLDNQLEEVEDKSAWVTVVASILAAVSLLILVAIAFLFVNDGKQRIIMMRPQGRGSNSDLHKLISDADPLIQGEPSKRPATEKKKVRFEDK